MYSFFSAPYVKVYLLENGAYVAKKKTKIARKTLDPLYQQTLQFEESPQGKVLQVGQCSLPFNVSTQLWSDTSMDIGFACTEWFIDASCRIMTN